MTLARSHAKAGPAAGGRSYSLAFGHQRSALLLIVVLASYVVLKPFYVLPSGLPQLGDLLVVGAIPFALLLPQPRLSDDAHRFQLYLALFCGYAALVSVAWTFILMDPSMAVSATYYAFNLCLVIVCLRVGALYPRETLRTIAYAISVSAVFQAASIALTYNAAEFRQIASFNNPNQLGYWSLLSICIFWSIAGKMKIKWYVQAPTIICLVYTTAVALSKSGMISVALLCVLQYVKKPRLLLAGLILLVPVYFALENSDLLERVKYRLENIGQQSDDTLETRGYDRIIHYPQYLVLGAAEGGLYRYGEIFDNYHEMHSTLGTILFSYGVVGLIFFGAAIWCLYRISSDGRFLYLLPPFLHGIAHQGLRFSFLWLLFAVLVVLSGMDEGRPSPQNNKHGLTRS